MSLSSMDSREFLEVTEGQADRLDQGTDVTSGRRIENFSVQARRQLVVKLYLKEKMRTQASSPPLLILFMRVCFGMLGKRAGREM